MTSWTLEHHGRIKSTNDLLKERARLGAADRTVLVATEQSEGHGRGGHDWTSPPGGLYASVLLREVPGPLAPLLAFAAGEAVMRTLSSLRIDTPVWLKWPNDILIAPPGTSGPVGKAGGILVESVSSGERLAYAVVGLGLNLHTEAEDLPADLDPPAVAFTSFQAQVPERSLFLDVFLGHLDEVLHQFAVAPNRLVQAVERRLAWRGEKVALVHASEGALTGILWGLQPSGALRLDTATGEQTLDAWDVRDLRPAPDPSAPYL